MNPKLKFVVFTAGGGNQGGAGGSMAGTGTGGFGGIVIPATNIKGGINTGKGTPFG